MHVYVFILRFLPAEYLSEVERQDDQIALAMSHFHNKPLDDSSLQALTDKTFPIETTNRDLLIVLFYLPCKFLYVSNNFF